MRPGTPSELPHVTRIALATLAAVLVVGLAAQTATAHPAHGLRMATPCADGTSSSSTGRGTCSHHGGIAGGDDRSGGPPTSGTNADPPGTGGSVVLLCADDTWVLAEDLERCADHGGGPLTTPDTGGSAGDRSGAPPAPDDHGALDRPGSDRNADADRSTTNADSSATNADADVDALYRASDELDERRAQPAPTDDPAPPWTPPWGWFVGAGVLGWIIALTTQRRRGVR